MKKILLVSCGGLGNGGVQAVLMSIVRHLHMDYNFDILLFTRQKRYYDDEFLSYGGKIIRIPVYEGTSKVKKKLDYYIRGHKIYKKALTVLKENGPYEAIHCCNEFEGAFILKAAYKVGIPTRIMHTHVIYQPSNIVLKIINNHRKKEIGKFSTCNIGCSRQACESFYQKDTASYVINNAFDDTKFKSDLVHLNDQREFNIVQVGSLSKVKNQLFSLEVISQIKSRYPDVKLQIIGFERENYLDQIDGKIKRLQINANVEILPGDSNIPRYLESAAGFIFPSLHEGFGMALVEAQAMGVKCYASNKVPNITNCGGVTYLSLDSVDSWANTIMNDYKLLNGKHRVYDVQKFELKQIIPKYRALYEGCAFKG